MGQIDLSHSFFIGSCLSAYKPKLKKYIQINAVVKDQYKKNMLLSLFLNIRNFKD